MFSGQRLKEIREARNEAAHEKRRNFGLFPEVTVAMHDC